MQRYRITLNANVREHRHQFVAAENAEAAIRKSLEAGEWEPVDGSYDPDQADADEPTFWVTPVDESENEVVTTEGIDDEYRHPGDYVYRNDLLAFAKMLAVSVAESNGLVNDETGATMTPESIRTTARHLLKMD